MNWEKWKKFIKDNYLYLLILLPIIFIILNNIYFNNDLWFLLNHGRYVLSNGIPTIEPFTIHTNLSFVMQQWLSSTIFWCLYHYLGSSALFLFIIVMGIGLLIMFYKLSNLLTQNKIISILMTVLLGLNIKAFIVSRPQIFTYLILLLELYLLEKYFKSNNWKYLIGLPILSVCLINLHASMWFMLFAFFLPYLLSTISLQKRKVLIDKKKGKNLFFCLISMFLAGFINPYGIHAITYLFGSYNITEINNTVAEMFSLNIDFLDGKIILLCLFVLILILMYKKNNRIELRYYLLFIGTLLLTCMHIKAAIYFYIIYFLLLALLLKDIHITELLPKKKVFIVLYCLFFIVISLGTIGVTIYAGHENASHHLENRIKDTVDFMEKNYNLADIVLYVGYDDGGYTEYRGIKSYIDPRAEVFVKKNNHKEDIFKEYYKLIHDYTFDYEEFVNKYQFTHLIVNYGESFDKFLANSSEYQKVFTQSQNGKPLMNLYVRN